MPGLAAGFPISNFILFELLNFNFFYLLLFVDQQHPYTLQFERDVYIQQKADAIPQKLISKLNHSKVTSPRRFVAQNLLSVIIFSCQQSSDSFASINESHNFEPETGIDISTLDRSSTHIWMDIPEGTRIMYVCTKKMGDPHSTSQRQFHKEFYLLDKTHTKADLFLIRMYVHMLPNVTKRHHNYYTSTTGRRQELIQSFSLATRQTTFIPAQIKSLFRLTCTQKLHLHGKKHISPHIVEGTKKKHLHGQQQNKALSRYLLADSNNRWNSPLARARSQRAYVELPFCRIYQ